ncbi:MAG: hypothetical protein LBP78_02760 [Acidaminococcales bacterium]|jgi:hypothetical protein|nr:hypothetical protein [Acidaminococcales bacterium]
MFPNLKAEMDRLTLTTEDLARVLKKEPAWVEKLLRGKAALPVSLAIVIKKKFFPYCSYEYLFAGAGYSGSERLARPVPLPDDAAG